MDPPWLKGRDCHYARILRFIDSRIEGRTGDERLSAVIEFDEEIELKGLRGKFGVILGRWEGQEWEATGVVHVDLLEVEISEVSEMTRENSRWVESHASYERING